MDGDRLAALLADAAAAEAALDRSKERMLRQAAAEEATFTGTLLELGESQARVALHLSGGRVHRGHLSAVARDFVVLTGDQGRHVAIPTAAIASVRAPARSGRDTAGDREPPIGASLAGFLSGIAPDRPLVQVGVTGDDSLLLGTLRSVGADVATLQLDSADRQVALIPLAAVTDVVLLDR